MIGRYINDSTRITLVQTFNYAFRNLYGDDMTRIPRTSAPNSIVSFTANVPTIATVDWGDGIVEDFPFIKQQGKENYVCFFRSLDDNTRYGNTGDWGMGSDESGTPIDAYANHKYADNDADKERQITISFSSNGVVAFLSSHNIMTGFPIIESGSMTSLSIYYSSQIKEIPFDRIAKMENLTSLVLTSLGARLEVIPSGIFNLKNLVVLVMSGIFNLQNNDSSNLRKIGGLPNLKQLDLGLNNITTYVKEFKNLTQLTYLDISSNIEGSPNYDEVTAINPTLTNLQTHYLTSARTDWDNRSGKGIENLMVLNVWSNQNINVGTLPPYILEMRSMSQFKMGMCLTTQDRADTFVNSLYDLVTKWGQITMATTAQDGKRNQFYGLYLELYSPTYPSDKRPSGTYQPPTGFIQGFANGNPASPEEKLYVLAKNYNNNIVVKPETLRKTRNIIPDGYYLDDSVIYNQGETIYNNEIKPIKILWK